MRVADSRAAGMEKEESSTKAELNPFHSPIKRCGAKEGNNHCCTWPSIYMSFHIQNLWVILDLNSSIKHSNGSTIAKWLWMHVKSYKLWAIVELPPSSGKSIESPMAQMFGWYVNSQKLWAIVDSKSSREKDSGFTMTLNFWMMNFIMVLLVCYVLYGFNATHAILKALDLLHLHEIMEGLYFHCSLSVCVSVCLSVCLCVSLSVSEQIISRTDAPIWTRFVFAK